MPNRDGKGPDGNGPKTGRGLGPCNSPSTVVVPRRNKRGRRD